jgi:hypothetical protein
VSSAPEKRVRHRSMRDEVTELSLTRALYVMNPEYLPKIEQVIAGIEPPAADTERPVHWTGARSYNTPKWQLAQRQALAIHAMFQPYVFIYPDLALRFTERLLRTGVVDFSAEDIDRAIQVAVEEIRDEVGSPNFSPDSDMAWAVVEERVLMNLDIDQGAYYSEVTG